MIDEATVEAEKIKSEANEKLVETYNKAYEETKAEADRRALELKNKAKEDAKREAESIISNAEEQKEEIRVKARERFQEAVNAILEEITF